MTLIPRDTTGLIWLVFAAYWVYRAFSVKKTVYAESLGARSLQFVLWSSSFFIMYSDRLHDSHLALPLFTRSNGTVVLGTIIVGLGVAFAIWARRHLGAYWSSTVTLKENHKLIRSGPYGLSRHPIYTGVLLAFLGTIIAMGELRSVVAIAIILIAIALKIRDEESVLQKHFPSDYLDYKREVKMLIPGIW